MSRRVLLKPTHRYGCFSGCSRDVNQRARGLEWEVMWQDRKVKKLHMTEWVLLLKVHLVHQQHLSTEQWPWDIHCPAKPILLESSPIPLIFFPIYKTEHSNHPACNVFGEFQLTSTLSSRSGWKAQIHPTATRALHDHCI